MATSRRNACVEFGMLVATLLVLLDRSSTLGAAKKYHRNGSLSTLFPPMASVATQFPSASRYLGSCACHLDLATHRLSCSGLNDFSELCIPALGRSSDPEVTTLAIADSNFTNFSFKFLDDFPHVENMTLRNNRFADRAIRPSSGSSDALQVLDVSANHLSRLPHDVLKRFPKLKILDLSVNDLNTLDRNLFEANKDLREIRMNDNPFWCHDMEWFLDWVKATPEVTVHDRHKINCTYYERNTNFGSVTFESLIDHCPTNCSCNKFRSVIRVYCQNKGYRSFPTMLPDTSSVLHMENNQIESLHTLVNGSNYITVRFLHVDNNSIDSINILERTDFFNELNSLHISGNRLTQLPTHMIDRMMSICLDEVKLGNNPWNCECNVVAPFHDLLIKHYQKFKDIDQIRCASDDPHHPNQPIHKLSKHDFCAKVNYINPLDIVNVCLIALILLIIGKVFYDYRRLKQTGQLPVAPFQCFAHRDRR